ncbi:putative protein [Geobacter sp. OR-1]|uniref:class I SAM-dependent methyltransferase n=1 Tax=Geobacter sp. OR-1 TaxID=1266765 RepID=UPI000542DEB8|nr:class I SAM-dependent methyltransferase [Geobacter sp. OR-1]GAM10725.1 putative protein [Geobacter sp. OR-1]
MINIQRSLGLLINPDEVYFDYESPSAKVMNYGCGNRKKPGHIGVDIVSSADADYVVSPGAPLPFADNTFDMVISRYVLEHVHDLDQLLCEISRILKPNGVFRFCVPHAFSIDMYDDPTHCRFITLRTMNYFTGLSNVHYTSSRFTRSIPYLRLTLAWPRLRLIRYPVNIILGGIGMLAPFCGEQLIKLPFINGTLFFELRK